MTYPKIVIGTTLKNEFISYDLFEGFSNALLYSPFEKIKRAWEQQSVPVNKRFMGVPKRIVLFKKCGCVVPELALFLSFLCKLSTQLQVLLLLKLWPKISLMVVKCGGETLSDSSSVPKSL